MLLLFLTFGLFFRGLGKLVQPDALPGPRMLPYAVRLAQRALEQADYGLWQLQGRLFLLIN